MRCVLCDKRTWLTNICFKCDVKELNKRLADPRNCRLCGTALPVPDLFDRECAECKKERLMDEAPDEDNENHHSSKFGLPGPSDHGD